ncbi:YafY family protein [Clostridium aestuarii]|uniref:YafY family protein n=1 Tax=Clostridium aestuarii TaxID=338193 RepID=A0ABT4CZN7_9CLOT|nr:YafY family protein [Clostridium aestuarii]MCY6483847.1 YafY family protein [Clostridium aestuarii]
MQIDRLFQIVYILLDKKRVTAKELSEIFEVSKRTIYRDIEKLSMAGIPIYANKGNGGGISLLNNFVMNKSVLSNEEQNNLLIGLEILKATEYENVDGAILKLKNLFNKNIDNWIEVDFSNWGSSKAEKTKFEMLKFALTNCRSIKFNYYNFSGDKTNRIVNPIKLIFKHKAWYLQAFCLLKNDFRTFKVYRIKDLIVTEGTFDRNCYNSVETNFSYQHTSNVINLKIILSSQVKHRVYDEFDEKDITRNKDGSFSINIMVAEDEWLYNYIISFGQYINIIEPKYIRGIIKNKLELTLKKYK